MIKKILHLSDLHFGTERLGILPLLIQDCKKMDADMIVVSGDLTQRAKSCQFQAAKQFLSNFKQVFCVPGNHDIALYNPLERFLYPFAKYKKWIFSDLCQHYTDENFAILGINSVTAFKSMGGYVTEAQLNLVKNYFASQSQSVIKMVVMHHNLISSERHKIINDADKILEIFSNAGVNFVLSGHIHYPCIELIQKKYTKHNLYVITAGTAISTRTLAPNSYNILEFNNKAFFLTVRSFKDTGFISEKTKIYSL